MILRFPNYMEAALAVTRLRDEGYYAALCDVHMGTIWVPQAVGGVRVIVSEGPIEEDAEPPPTFHGESVLERTWRVLFLVLTIPILGLIGITLLMGIFNVLVLGLKALVAAPLNALFVVVSALVLAAVAVLILWASDLWFRNSLLRREGRAESIGDWILRLAVLFPAIEPALSRILLAVLWGYW